MNICPECRSFYTDLNITHCERDDELLFPVQYHQDQRKYNLLNQTVDGRYLLIGGLGQGGLGTVYLAKHILLDQLCAVKFLDIQMLLQSDEEQQKETLQDFMREARIATVVQHESVVRVSDYGIFDKNPYLVMDYIPGPSLLRKMKEKGKFPIAQSITLIQTIAQALDAFHKRKLVHRDLKPANVILDPRENGRLTLVDLGLVKDLSNAAKSSTHPLALRGTPGYLAPEQVPGWVLSTAGVTLSAEKKAVDAKVDIYALGVLAYELITGLPPYPKGLSANKIIVYACTQDPPDIEESTPEIEDYPGLSNLISQMMDRDPSQRPKSGAEVFQKLEEILLDYRSLDSPQKIREEIQKAQANLVLQIQKPTPPKGQSSLLAPPKVSHTQTSSMNYQQLPNADQSDSMLDTQDFSLDGSGSQTAISDQSEDIFDSQHSQNKTAIQGSVDFFNELNSPPRSPKNQLVPMNAPTYIPLKQSTYQGPVPQRSFEQTNPKANPKVNPTAQVAQIHLPNNSKSQNRKVLFAVLFIALFAFFIIYFYQNQESQKITLSSQNISQNIQNMQTNLNEIQNQLNQNQASQNQASQNQASQNQASQNQASQNQASQNQASQNQASQNQAGQETSEIPILKIIESPNTSTSKKNKTEKTSKFDKEKTSKSEAKNETTDKKSSSTQAQANDDEAIDVVVKTKSNIKEEKLDDLFNKGIEAIKSQRHSDALNYFNQFLDKAPKTHPNYNRAILYRDRANSP
jgi:serine/threonine protein kinase